MNKEDKLTVLGARVHNLKNVDVEIPRQSLTVFTGLSGSGKSSLAFDTIYAEGQRRYIETFSAYARNFLGNMERPDVDLVTGLSPVISIEQKTTNKNPRSTVGTTTEVYDFLRLLYARAGEAYSYVTGEKMVKYTEEQILGLLHEDYAGRKVYLLAPLVKNRKGHYRELFETIQRKGFLYVRVDGNIVEVAPGMKLDRYKNHSIEVVVDRLVIPERNDELENAALSPQGCLQSEAGQECGMQNAELKNAELKKNPKGEANNSAFCNQHSALFNRLQGSVANALRQGEGEMLVYDVEADEVRHYSRHLMCPTSGIAYRDPAPHDFSFNSPQGACPHCHGLGYVSLADIDKVIPDRSLSIRQGALAPVGKYKNSLFFQQLSALLERHDGATLDTPVSQLPQEAIDEVFYGCQERLRIPAEVARTSSDYFVTYEGLVKYLQNIKDEEQSATAQKWVEQFSRTTLCPECHGQRLRKESLHFRLGGKNIAELSAMDLSELYQWMKHLDEKLNDTQRKIAAEIIKEICTRLHFLLDVGLDYLSLGRSSVSLSGGESQRIRLATQIGSQLVNVLYILDEPSIGLHQRDNRRLIRSLKSLRDLGNTVIVVEHDQEMMEQADYIVDMGPRAGRLGGEVVFQGTYKEMVKTDTLTSRYLNGKEKIEIPAQRRQAKGAELNAECKMQNAESSAQPAGMLAERSGARMRNAELSVEGKTKKKHSAFSSGQWLSLYGCTGNNLQSVDVHIPLGTLVCVTGVSGSGKSTLINDTLQPILSQHFYRSLRDPLPYERIEGMEFLDKVVDVDQSPLGRTPRSNPATYTGVFNDIRNLFVQLPEAKIRGYKPGRFSFNVKGGRCEACTGNGYKTIEMNFLPDVFVPCEQCQGKRYNRETLEVRFRGKSIADVLDMTINQAVEFFQNQPAILQKIKVLQDVGLGYIKLGQPSTTLSGGESQRVKLATELAKRDTGNTLYILDEPTTGLHFEDIRQLLSVLNRLVEKGNTVLVIEHNLDIIKSADYILDMGPEGGRRGGKLLSCGTPEQVAQSTVGFTPAFLREML